MSPRPPRLCAPRRPCESQRSCTPAALALGAARLTARAGRARSGWLRRARRAGARPRWQRSRASRRLRPPLTSPHRVPPALPAVASTILPSRTRRRSLALTAAGPGDRRGTPAALQRRPRRRARGDPRVGGAAPPRVRCRAGRAGRRSRPTCGEGGRVKTVDKYQQRVCACAARRARGEIRTACCVCTCPRRARALSPRGSGEGSEVAVEESEGRAGARLERKAPLENAPHLTPLPRVTRAARAASRGVPGWALSAREKHLTLRWKWK
jgi:hypothetical protein